VAAAGKVARWERRRRRRRRRRRTTTTTTNAGRENGKKARAF